ncbi:MAG TPA: glycosyltransferase family 1 protein [Aggregatilineales bacterium]|nr:glycosyltransferase family 1 protein [Aggregatilineales bacterium]
MADSPHIGINAHLLSGKAGYRSAGIHGYIAGTLTHLQAAAPDWRFTVMVGRENGLTFDGLTMRRAGLDTESPLRRILWEQIAQPTQLGDFDLLHSMAFVSPLILTKPSLVTVYDLSFIHYPQVLSTARRVYLRLFTALSCQRARRVIAISHSTARDLSQSLGIPAEKIDVAAPGYDASLYRPLPPDEVAAFKREKGLPDRFWLFLGTLEPRKNLVTLIEAYAALAPADRLPLILAGGKGWDYQPIFDAVARHGLQSIVQFPGYLPFAELPFWYNGADCFLYPSVFEGFGLPALEAMACGTPVIVSEASSLPEVVGSAGMSLPPMDVTAWTAALKRAAHDPHWRQSAREQGLWEAARYSYVETARQHVASYRRALG